MRFPRMTTRRWMVILPVVAVACWWLAELIRLHEDDASLIIAPVESRRLERVQILLGVTAGLILLLAVSVARWRRRSVEPDPPMPD